MRDLSECQILVVDDTEANVDILVETLADDYAISVALDGENALEFAFSTPPDLILLDIMMPGLDGYEVCARLKQVEATRDIPIIFVTAMAETGDELKGFALGAVDYITKPFSPPVVRARVKTHLTLKLAREQLAAQNEELLAAARLREDVENITRHDLKGPLNSILGLPPLMKADPRLVPEFRAHLEIIEESGRRMLRMINQSLDLFKMEQGRYRLEPVPVDLLGTVTKIFGEIQGLAARKRLLLESRIDGCPTAGLSGFWVLGEDLLSYSLLSNLIKNALEASPGGATLTVEFRGGQRPRVGVHNQGAVPLEIRANFFEKYVTAGKSGGTGLGTYSARLMAETQGGGIELTTSEEAGTTITVTWPAAVSTPVAPQVPADQPAKHLDPANLPAWRILLADDDRHTRDLLAHYLVGGPLIPELAADGREALGILTTRDCRLAFLDGEMPELNGFEVARRVREWERARGAVPMILVALTGHDEPAMRAKAVEAGFTAYLTKPVGRAEFLETIARTARDGLSSEVVKAASAAPAVGPPRPSLDEEAMVTEIDADFEELLNSFLFEKRGELAWAGQTLAEGQLEALRAWGHKLGGTGRMYGLDELGRLGKTLESQAQEADTTGLAATLARLTDYLGRLRIVYVDQG